MKKFMKAIAFVTVMCMALSTVAFAETESPFGEVTDKTFTVTVKGAGNNEQVALYIVEAKEGASTTDDPLYIDQTAANGSGTAEFTAKIAGDVKAVKVFVGYAANTTGKAIDLGEVQLVEAETAITVKKESTKTLDTNNGVGATFTVTAPANVQATRMIWAINIGTEAAPVYKYTDSFDITEYYIGTVIENGSNVTLGLVFENADNTAISGVEAIFMFNNGKDAATKDLSGDKAPNNQSGGNE